MNELRKEGRNGKEGREREKGKKKEGYNDA